MIRLSLCIPTYNRGRFIGETLESIVQQATDEIEIVISDNASEDNTEEVVRVYQEKFPRITYFRWDRNMGADKNFLKVIDLANGQYCWFIGSDDVLEKNGIGTVLASLSRNLGLSGMSVNSSGYSFDDMNIQVATYPVGGGKIRNNRSYGDLESIFSDIGYYIGYISGQVVRRDLWNQVVYESGSDLALFFNAYVHVYIIARMLQKSPRWLFVYDRCVKWRSDNDSFLDRGHFDGHFKRLALDVVGYDSITRQVFGSQSRIHRIMQKKVSTLHLRYHLLSAKYRGEKTTFYWKVFKLCFKTYWRCPSFWFQTFPILVMYRPVILGIHWFYKRAGMSWSTKSLLRE